MRPFKLTLSSLALLLLLCAPAPGQDAPAISQYAAGSCPQGSVACVQSVNGSVEDFADNAGQGTDAVNDAFDQQTASASASASAAASAPDGSASDGSAPDGSASPGDGAGADTATGSSATAAPGSVAAGDVGAAGVASEEGLASITELPETGGPPLATLISGVLLAALGLMARRLAL